MQINKKDKIRALKLARDAIKEYLINHKKIAPLNDGIFKENGAVFVTLHTKTNHQLRGCIGSIIAYRPLGVDIVEHAIDSAVNDPRFNRLSIEELDNIEIEISILTPPKLLEYQNSEDLINKLKIGVDRVIIKYLNHQATFLPSVWSELNNKELFLSHLCLKAGLEPNFYKTNQLEVYVYNAIVFSENSN